MGEKERKTLFDVEELLSYEEIIQDYLREFPKYVSPEGDTVFGLWMQTLADLELLDLELRGLRVVRTLLNAFILAKLKNDLLFIEGQDIAFSTKESGEIFQAIECKKWQHPNSTIYYLMVDAFERTSSYDKMGKIGLFIKEFQYIKDRYYKTKEIQNKYGLKFSFAEIYQGDILELKDFEESDGKFDAVIISPPLR